MRAWRAVGLATRAAAVAAVVPNVVRAARRLPPVAPAPAPHRLAVVIPARDEATRIGPLLTAVVGADGVDEVVVVDDESADGTAAFAAAAGARVVVGQPAPTGWVGKAWALQQGLDAATSPWVVFLDADTRPAPTLPAALVARAVADGLDLLTVGGRFECPTAGLRWLHPALLTTLVYRAAPPGSSAPGPVHRRIGNGQCMAVRRDVLVAAGGFGAVAHHTVEDVALVRAMATAGFAVAMLDASELLTVRMYETAPDAWRGWGRSLPLPGVDGRGRRALSLVTVALTQAAPLARVVVGRADLLDVALLALRAGTLVGTAGAYTRRGAPYWLSPTADLVAVAALVRSSVGRPRAWRGRAVTAPDGRPARTAGRRST